MFFSSILSFPSFFGLYYSGIIVKTNYLRYGLLLSFLVSRLAFDYKITYLNVISIVSGTHQIYD